MQVLAALLLVCVSARTVPEFTIDLDSPASERWREVVLHYKWSARPMQEHFKAFLDKNVRSDELEMWEEAVNRSMSNDQVEELDGILNVLNDSYISRRLSVLSQAMYELQYSPFCSGTLAAMENGTVVHGRNMDYMLPFTVDGTTYNWPDVTFEVTFIRNGTPLMTSVTWPGQLGIHTAMRFGGWSFEQNTRTVGNNRSLNLAAGLGGSQVYALFARQQMERIENFAAAVDVFKNADFMAPSYFIMAGSGKWEGAILTISRQGQVNGCEERSSSEDDWLLLQTNDDWCGKAEDFRRPVANWTLPHQLPGSTSVNASAVMNVMTHIPLMTFETAFSWVAIPATGFHETVLSRAPKVPPTDRRASLLSWQSKWNKATARGHIGIQNKAVLWRLT